MPVLHLFPLLAGVSDCYYYCTTGWLTYSSQASIKVRPDLEGPFSALRETARRVGRATAEAGVPGSEDMDEYVDSFRPDLMEIVAAWCSGARFADIAKMSDDLFEV